MKTPAPWLIAAVCWISALGMFVASRVGSGFSILAVGAAMNAVVAMVFPVIAAKQTAK